MLFYGWIVVEEAAPGMKPQVLVEWTEGTERKRVYMDSRGESGCAEAIEWWDKRLRQQVTLEPTIRGLYRVKGRAQ